MSDTTTILGYQGKDGLRLLGLSRIPRCAACSIFKALRKAYRSGTSLTEPLPPACDVECNYQYCAPLVTRFSPVQPG